MSGEGDATGGDESDDDAEIEYGLEEFGDGDPVSTGRGTDRQTDDGSGEEEPPEWSGGDPTDPGGGSASDEPPEWSGGDPTADDELLDPDGLLDNTLTVVVGILAGIVIGLVGTLTMLFATGDPIGFLLGVVAWLGATAYLVRRRTVLGAVAHGAYGVAIVLLLVPLVMLSPFVDAGGAGDRFAGFLGLLLFVGIPAGIAAAVGFVVSRYAPEDGSQL